MKQTLLCLLATLGLVCGASAAGKPVEIFNGKDLTGWVQKGGKAKYEVKDGVIIGTTVTNTPNSFLCTEKAYGDFILELEFRVDPKMNSGVQIRSEVFDKPTEVEAGAKKIKIAAGRVHGYQVEIDMDPAKNRWWEGGLYDEGRRGWLFPGSLGGNEKEFTAQGAKIAKQGDWNTIRVEAKGSSIKTFINGEPRASITDNMTPKGFIALQVHSVGGNAKNAGMKVEWRNIKLTEL